MPNLLQLQISIAVFLILLRFVHVQQANVKLPQFNSDHLMTGRSISPKFNFPPFPLPGLPNPIATIHPPPVSNALSQNHNPFELLGQGQKHAGPNLYGPGQSNYFANPLLQAGKFGQYNPMDGFNHGNSVPGFHGPFFL